MFFDMHMHMVFALQALINENKFDTLRVCYTNQSKKKQNKSSALTPFLDCSRPSKNKIKMKIKPKMEVGENFPRPETPPEKHFVSKKKSITKFLRFGQVEEK